MYDTKVLIRRLSQSTGIRDCSEGLWEFLGLTEDDVYGRSDEWQRMPLIADVPHDVWQCVYRNQIHWGRSLSDVAAKAGLKP